MRTRAVLVALAVLAAGAVSAADELSTRELKTIGEGRGLYVANCAGCHQMNLRGMAATATNIPDLTLITVRDGRFDRRHVSEHIRFGTQHPDKALQPGQMPYAVGAYIHSGRTAVEVIKLTRYIEFAQATPPVKD